MAVVNKVRPETGKVFYRYEVANPEVTSKLQKAYGDNLIGWVYNMYLAKDFKGVVAQKKYALNAGFDWENKADVLLLFAESSKELASQSIHSEVHYRKYKSMCLSAGSRAFKFVLRKHGGKMPPANDELFCRVFNAYWNYLDGFGQVVEAKSLENKYGALCPASGG